MNTEESSKITNFSEALKYLVDTGILISKLRKFEKVYWVTCLNKYFSLMTKTYIGEKTEKILNEDEYLSKFKTPFLLFFNENFQDNKIPLTIDDNFDDNWINFTESSLPTSKILNGKVIYQFPNEPKYSVISLPISDIYKSAIYLQKNGHEDKELPLRVIYGFFQCIKFSLSENSDFISKSLENIKEFDVEDEIKEDESSLNDLSKLMGPLAKQFGINIGDIPNGSLGNIDPNLMKSIGGVAQNLMANIKNNKNGKPKNMGDIIGTVTEAFNDPAVADLFNQINTSDELLKTIPTKDSI